MHNVDKYSYCGLFLKISSAKFTHCNEIGFKGYAKIFCRG